MTPAAALRWGSLVLRSGPTPALAGCGLGAAALRADASCELAAAALWADAGGGLAAAALRADAGGGLAAADTIRALARVTNQFFSYSESYSNDSS